MKRKVREPGFPGLPWYQLEGDFISTKAAQLGAMLRIPPAQALGMGALLIKHGVDRTWSREAPPHGIFASETAADELEAAMLWMGERGQAIRAMTLIRMVEPLPVGFRVKGTDRYEATWKKNQRRKTGRQTYKLDGEAAEMTETGPVPRGTGPQDVDVDQQQQQVITTAAQGSKARRPPRSAGKTSQTNFQKPAAAVAALDDGVQVDPATGAKTYCLGVPRGCWELFQAHREDKGLHREAMPETFPGWHQAKLEAFGEEALGRAYWNYLETPAFGERHAWATLVFMKDTVCDCRLSAATPRPSKVRL